MMACADHMEQLSLLDGGQTDSIEVKEQLPFKQSIVAAKLDGVHTDIVICEYSNRVFIVITQCQKVAAFISANKDIAQETCGIQEDIYLVRTIFGAQQEDSQEVVARFLAEHTKIEKPAIFALGLRDHSPRTVRALATIINTHKSW